MNSHQPLDQDSLIDGQYLQTAGGATALSLIEPNHSRPFLVHIYNVIQVASHTEINLV